MNCTYTAVKNYFDSFEVLFMLGHHLFYLLTPLLYGPVKTLVYCTICPFFSDICLVLYLFTLIPHKSFCMFQNAHPK
jgi:hypothetical protein